MRRRKSGIRVVMNTGDDTKVTVGEWDFLFRLMGTGGQIEFYGWALPYRIQNAAYPQGLTVTPEEFPIIGHRRHLENMAAMIERGEPDYTIADSSLLALEICEGAYLSSRHRCRVTFPVDRFVPPAASDWDPGSPMRRRRRQRWA